MLSLKVKIKLDVNQELIVNTLSNEHRLLYNKLLESIKEKPLTFKELNQVYKNYRLNEQLTINSKSAQNTCINLINNIKSFYALRKKDISAKFPYKFKSHKYFTSFMYDFNHGSGGFKITGNGKLIVNLLSHKESAIKLIIDLPKYCNKINYENVKTLTFKKEADCYYLIFVYSETPSNKIENRDFLSIDLGYSQLATCYSNKIDNFSIENLRLKKLQKRIEYLQSIKDKKKKGSKKYIKANKTFKRVKRKQVNKVKDFQHKISTLIIEKCIDSNIGNLIVGDIKVKKIINKNNNKINGLSKSTLTLGRFKTFLEYKSERAGLTYHSVNEAYTSQQNCLTDEILFSSALNIRSVEVSKGLFVDRDLNSAINIAKKVKVTWSDHMIDFNLSKMFFNNHSGKMEELFEFDKIISIQYLKNL